MEAFLYSALFAPLVGSVFGIPFATREKVLSVAIFASLMIGVSFLSSLFLFVYTFPHITCSLSKVSEPHEMRSIRNNISPHCPSVSQITDNIPE